jgi:hypothetical protein
LLWRGAVQSPSRPRNAIGGFAVARTHRHVAGVTTSECPSAEFPPLLPRESELPRSHHDCSHASLSLAASRFWIVIGRPATMRPR